MARTRYEVRPILTGQFGPALISTDDPDEAKQFARQRAADYYYGTAILDTTARTADLGDRVVPIGEAFACDGR